MSEEADETFLKDNSNALKKTRKRKYEKNNKLSVEMRGKIISNHQQGKSISCIAEYERLPITTVRNIISIFNTSGRTESLKRGGSNNTKMTPEISASILTMVDEDAGISLKRISQLIFEKFQVNITKSSIL